MDRVWRHSRVRQGDLLVLLAIADFADDDGRAFPSIATLAEKSRLKERMTQYAIRNLVEIGELEIEPNGGPRGCHVYHVRTLEADAEVAPVQNLRGAISDRGGATHCAKGVQPIAPKPSLTVTEPSGGKGKKKRRNDVDDDFLDGLRNNPAYRLLDIDVEVGKAQAWIAANPGRLFTRRFLVSWLNRATKKPQTDALGRPTSASGFKNPLRQDFNPREVLR